MADNTHIIEVKTKGAKKSEKQVKGVNAALGKMAKQAGAAAAAYFGSQALLSAIRSSIDLFAQQELAEKKLRFAAGASTNELIRQASALQQNSVFGDEAIIAQQAYVKSLGVSTEQTKEIIAASVDLSAALGISLQSAVINTTKTLSGMQGEIGEKLPAAFKQLTAEQLKAGEGITFIRNQFRGTAKEEAQTLTGALTQASNAFGDLQEKVGERFAPVLNDLTKSFTDLITLNPSEEAIKEKIEFEKLLGVLTNVNSAETSRKFAIQQLKEEYSGYLGDLDLEKASLEDIVKLQTEQVKAMEQGILQKQLAEELEEITEKRIKAERKLFDLEQNASESFTMNLGGMAVVQNNVSKDRIGSQHAIINNLKEEEEQIKANHQAFLDRMSSEEEFNNNGGDDDTDTDTDGDDGTDTIDEFNKKLDEFIKKKENDAAATQLQIDLNDAYILKMREQGQMLDVMTSKEKKHAEEKSKGTKTTLSVIDSIGKLQKNEKVASVTSALSNAYEAANSEFMKYSKKYPAPTGTILGIAAAAAAVSRGLKNADEIKKAQYGADFITSGPQLMMVGEGSGPERVQVTPLVDPNLEGPQGQAINVNISGNVMHESFVEDNIIPSIREGLRLGENIGL
tara:strand:- start:5299 stop:7173 length:1875 start_codon:yes stop_codon:yes gene_type:complete